LRVEPVPGVVRWLVAPLLLLLLLRPRITRANRYANQTIEMLTSHKVHGIGTMCPSRRMVNQTKLLVWISDNRPTRGRPPAPHLITRMILNHPTPLIGHPRNACTCHTQSHIHNALGCSSPRKQGPWFVAVGFIRPHVDWSSPPPFWEYVHALHSLIHHTP
jgi:hypothetical protein